MKKKYYGLQVHTLTFSKVDENGDSIDGKQYEYTGDHSSFCEGIDDEYLEEVSGEQASGHPDGEDLHRALAMASGPGAKLQATSIKLQATSGKLDKK